MKPSLLLRIASVLTLLLAVGHTTGGLSFWSPAGETDVLRAMRSFHFDAAGASRTYLDFYLGFGYVNSVYLFLQTVVLWQLASLAKTDAVRVRPLIGSLLLASVASAALAWRFIFVVPVVSFLAIAVCLGLAFYAAGKRG
ncbi:LIC_13387 family protein [Dyella choica]|uniref:Uncharacterized protein n=1 Tax=Dyella choica TaxID=1927959 RepID=A0A3S0PRM6_9GAMM|nr:hypothetical protein [Dyella choica]RUL79944.1 hypothetical protein EKH80_01765 [Dyella choica]